MQMSVTMLNARREPITFGYDCVPITNREAYLRHVEREQARATVAAKAGKEYKAKSYSYQLFEAAQHDPNGAAVYPTLRQVCANECAGFVRIEVNGQVFEPNDKGMPTLVKQSEPVTA